MQKIMPSKCQWMATNRIKTKIPFQNLFPIKGETIQAISQDMEANGYDQSQPIILWKEEAEKKNPVVVDGHCRLLAAKKIGLSPVYIARVSFPDEQAALDYAIHNQRDRRNMTDADLLRCIEAVDKRKRKGERTDLASSEAKLGKSAEETAEVVGTSKTKVEKARTVLDHADEETKQEVIDGKKSIHKAAKETQRKRKGLVDPIDRELAALGRYGEERYGPGYDKKATRDIGALYELYSLFHRSVVGFQMNHRDKKRAWKKYLTEIHKWTSNLEALTKMWLEQLEKKKSRKEDNSIN